MSSSVAVEPALQPRAHGRAQPVTPWRQMLAGLSDQIVDLIAKNEDPERRFLTAREVAEDVQHAIKIKLSTEYGVVFDPLIDGR